MEAEKAEFNIRRGSSVITVRHVTKKELCAVFLLRPDVFCYTTALPRRMIMGIEVLDREIRFFRKIKEDLVKTHKGKVALIKNEQLVDTFTTFEEAYRDGIKRFGKEPFFVKPIAQQEEQQQIPALTANLVNANL
jgi:hypothetical protein